MNNEIELPCLSETICLFLDERLFFCSKFLKSSFMDVVWESSGKKNDKLGNKFRECVQFVIL